MVRTHQHKTLGIRSIIPIFVGTAVLAGTSLFFIDHEDDVNAYPAGCVSQACREASDAATAAERKAAAAASNAQTLEGEVERLNAEIASSRPTSSPTRPLPTIFLVKLLRTKPNWNCNSRRSHACSSKCTSKANRTQLSC